jgi:hypothetical protein
MSNNYSQFVNVKLSGKSRPGAAGYLTIDWRLISAGVEMTGPETARRQLGLNSQIPDQSDAEPLTYASIP